MVESNAPPPMRGVADAGGATVLDVFALRDRVVDEYERFATSFTAIHACRTFMEQVEAIYAEKRYWPEPLIQINPSYKRSTDVGALAEKWRHRALVAPTSSARSGRPLTLYKHQEQAIALAADGESFVVTTGTGSGKSLCFFVPIVSHVLAARRSSTEPRTHAIVVYPMNALANSQMEELDKFIGQVPGDRPVTFARYTGQEDADERKRVADEPPDILLTNFMMLELLMTRQEETDRRVIGNCEGPSVSSCSTSSTRIAAARVLTSRCSCAVSASASSPRTSCASARRPRWRAREPSAQEPRGGRRGFQALRERDRREQRHRRDARANHRFDRHRGFGEAAPWRGHRCRHTAGHLRRRVQGAPARGVGGDASRHLVLGGRSALGPGEAHDGDRGGGKALGGIRPTFRRLSQRAARPSAGVERP